MVQFINNRFKGSEMTHKNEETVVDAQMHHPFRCLVAGPSQSGKSTFVHNLLLWQNEIIDICFDYVMIVLGTEANKNEILSSLKDELRPGVVEIIELKKLYETTELLKKNFSSEFEHFVKNKTNRKKKGCVTFDNLMSELSECGLLLDLFSKYSSHYDLTTIHIMQNVLFKAGGKHGSDHVTIYQNTHVLFLFKNPLDNTVIHTIAQCISRGKKYSELVDMLHHVLDHRYIVIMGDLKTSPKLKYHTDIFAMDPIPHQTIYHLEK